MESQMPDEMVVYYTITLAAHVSRVEQRVTRIVELREEIHPSDDDPPMLVTDSGLVECDVETADWARAVADDSLWPATWEFGY
jgi:hypothetical protein